MSWLPHIETKPMGTMATVKTAKIMFAVSQFRDGPPMQICTISTTMIRDGRTEANTGNATDGLR